MQNDSSTEEIYITSEYTTPIKAVFGGYQTLPRHITHYSDGSMYIEHDGPRIIQSGLPESLKQQMLAHYPDAKMV